MCNAAIAVRHTLSLTTESIGRVVVLIISAVGNTTHTHKMLVQSSAHGISWSQEVRPVIKREEQTSLSPTFLTLFGRECSSRALATHPAPIAPVPWSAMTKSEEVLWERSDTWETRLPHSTLTHIALLDRPGLRDWGPGLPVSKVIVLNYNK